MQAVRKEIWVRLWILRGVLGLMLLILAGRLWYLQILKGPELAARAERSRVRQIAVPPPRGVIYDRQGHLLAHNRLSYHLVLLPQAQSAASWQRTLTTLSRLTDLDPERLAELRLQLQHPDQLPLAALSIKPDLSIAEISRLTERFYDLPGVFVEPVAQRVYPQGRLAAHVLGYVGEIDQKDLKRWSAEGYRMGDIVGKGGLERWYERELQGKHGERLVLVNARNRFVAFVDDVEGQAWLKRRSRPPEPGRSLRLTLDMRLQQATEKALVGYRGAIVAVDPRDGSILAMASRPSFDLNEFIPRISTASWQRLLRSSDRPLLNRALAGLYPPGSTVKPIFALAGLQEGLITPFTSLSCSGIYHLGRWPFRCWSRHGTISLEAAISRSCDIYFYQLGRRLGPERMFRYAQAYGLGRLLGIDLPGEQVGQVPTPDWKERTGRGPWMPGDTINMSIGQGMFEVTPLALAMAAATLANGGALYRPHLAADILSPDGKVARHIQPHLLERLEVAPSAVERARHGMWRVVNAPNGTGRAARLPHVEVAGKTGSAETRKGLKTHAWFICFAPYQDPRIAVSVLLERAGGGGAVAAPVARQVLEAFFFPQGTQQTNQSRLAASITKEEETDPTE